MVGQAWTLLELGEGPLVIGLEQEGVNSGCNTRGALGWSASHALDLQTDLHRLC
jgi:hypothetical protein